MHPHFTGIVACLVASIGYATMDATTKLLVETVPAGWVLALRSAIVIAVVAAVFALTGRASLFRTGAWRLTTLRSFVFGLTSVLVVLAFTHLSLAETVAIYFLSPIFIVMLGAVILGEPLTRRAIVAAVVGFAGVVLIAQPTGENFSWYYLVPIAAAVTGALQDVLARRLRGHSPPGTLLLYGQVATLLLGCVVLPLDHWPTLGAREIGLIVFGAAMAVLAYFFIAVSFQKAPARIIAPLRYLNVVWAVVAGYVLFDSVPNAVAMTGIGLIVTAGLMCVWSPSR